MRGCGFDIEVHLFLVRRGICVQSVMRLAQTGPEICVVQDFNWPLGVSFLRYVDDAQTDGATYGRNGSKQNSVLPCPTVHASTKFGENRRFLAL